MDNPEEQYKEACIRFYKNYKDYLYSPNAYTPPPDYLAFFEKRYKVKFNSFLHPSLYKLSILDQFRDKLFCTAWLPDGQVGRRFSMIFQISAKDHVFGFLYFSPKEKEFVVNLDFYSENPTEFLKFVEKNREFEHTEHNVKSVGFGMK